MLTKRQSFTFLFTLIMLVSFIGLASGQPPRYCILMKPIIYWPPQCFQFYLADVTLPAPYRHANIGGGGCVLTQRAIREGWQLESGPYNDWRTASARMSLISPYGGDLYGCITALQEEWEQTGPGGGPLVTIEGIWDWFNHKQVKIYSDGSAEAFFRDKRLGDTWKKTDSGTWRRIGPRRYRITWQPGNFIDTLTLSEDGTELTGTNQFGGRVTATRRSP